jgi:hypothetical protein
MMQDSRQDYRASYAPVLEYGKSYYWHVKARDGAGNETGYTGTWSFTTTAFIEPETNIEAPTEGETLSGTTYSISVTATEGTDPLQKVEVSTDGGATWNDAGGTANSITLSPSSGGNTATVKALWDDEALYLAYEVTDTQLNASVTARDGSVWGEGGVEWAIDTLTDDGGSGDPNAPYMLPDDYHGIINILNTQYDSQGTVSGSPSSAWDGSWQSAVQFNGTINDNGDTDAGYTVEVKIPWTEIGYSGPPAGGTIVRMGFLLNDKDDASYINAMWPEGGGSSFENTANWGEVALSTENFFSIHRATTSPTIDGNLSEYVPANWSYEWTLPAEDYIPHQIQARGVDINSVADGTPASVNITVDNVAPSGISNESPLDIAVDQAITSTVTVNGGTDGSGVMEYSFEVAEDAGFTTGLQSSGWQTETSYAPVLEYGKTYYWHVKARDGSGNESAYTGAWRFTTEAADPGPPDETDGDGILDDGDSSGDIGDNPCTGGNTENCDDNCVNTPNPDQADADDDGIGDVCDNCRTVDNRDQLDTNADEDDNTNIDGMQHYGNACDADYDNNGFVGLEDFNKLRIWFGQSVPPAPEDIDCNGSGFIGLEDFTCLRNDFGEAPGPGIGD